MHLLFSLILATFALQPRDEPAASQPADSPASQPASQPGEPEWTLSRSHYPPEATDEKTYLVWCHERTAMLLGKAGDAPDPLTAARFRLAAANVTLSLTIEPFVSRWMLNLAGTEDVHAIRFGINEAREQLKAVSESFSEKADGAEKEGAGPDATLESLKAFADALGAIWIDAPPDELAAARQSAATGLAVLLEDDRKDVAASALLWQAVLYEKMGQSDRAFQLLPAATERLNREARSAQFHARLLRCRLLADRGASAAAAALLLQIEEGLTDWFPAGAEQDAATHAAMLGRLRVLDRWRASLDAAKESGEIAWCDKADARLKADALDGGNPVFVLGLEKTIPVLARATDALEDPTTPPAANDVAKEPMKATPQ